MRINAIAMFLVSAVLFGMTMAGDKPVATSAARLSAGTDLYNVQVGSQADAERLTAIGVEPLMKVRGGYLVLADENQGSALAASGLSYEFLAGSIERRQLAIDIHHDQSNVGKYPLVYEDGALRLFRIDPAEIVSGHDLGLAPVLTKNLRITYKPPVSAEKRVVSPDLAVPLDSLVDLISQDSLESYSHWLQNHGSRPAGSNGGSASILAQKFESFGYDSVYLDEFNRPDWQGEHFYHGWNVVAVKTGTLYSYDHIIIGAHFDTEMISPGADDNGSGTAAVLEMARVLRDIETNMTIIFILFDCEEEGLLGAYEYAERAFANRERIPFMLNLDMIAEIRNTDGARLFHGESAEFAELWASVAASLPSLGLIGFPSGSSGRSDHAPFSYYGYDVVFVREYIFSSVYHSARDSTTYMNFDYMTRMVKASLATAYYVDGTYIPDPALLFFCPKGMPVVIYPDATDTLRIEIMEYAGAVLMPGSVRLHCSINSGTYFTIPLTDMGDGHFEVELPAISCGDDLKYFVSAVDDRGRVSHYPISAEPVWAIKTSGVVVALDDNFQTNKGWTVSGDATSGHWVRYQSLANAGIPNYDYDGSGRMYMTDYIILKDVDNGSTILESPVIDVSHGKTTVEYARAFYNGTGLTGKTDVFRVYVNDGAGWAKIDSAGPTFDNEGDWVQRKFWLHEVRSSSDSLRLRFVAADEGLDSEVEAAVDAVKIIHYSVAPQIYTESVPSSLIGTEYNLQLEASGCYDPLTWSDKYGELEGTGLTLSSGGLLSGLPPDTGAISFTAYVQDAMGAAGEQHFSFHVWLPFECGDAGMDYQLNVGDAVYLVNFVFKGGPEPYPICVGDANGDEEVNVGDAVYLISHIFKGGPPPTEDCCSILF